MGKTYEALKKAEAEKGAKPPLESLSVDGREAPEVLWNVGPLAQVEYQKIRVWLTNPAAQGQRHQTVMVVGCHPGTGATTTAALLAATLAEGTKARVLIIDSNFRTPALNMIYQVNNNGGFTEAASKGVPFETHIQPTDRKNLYVLTCGRISTCPAEIFEGEAIDHLISQLKQKFDYIIFDAAPSLEFPDSYALAPKVDCIILVVQAEKTRIGDTQIAKRNLEMAGGQILGVVLNRQRDYTPAFLKRFLNI
ncbi:MAG: CpsD/CapB family tyrosine-protein kinase [Candidatus Binatia bacterium]